MLTAMMMLILSEAEERKSTGTFDTFRISCLTDTLQLQSTRRKEGTNTLRPASSFTNLYYGLTLKNGSRGILYHSIGVNGAMYVNYTDEAYIRQFIKTVLINHLYGNQRDVWQTF